MINQKKKKKTCQGPNNASGCLAPILSPLFPVSYNPVFTFAIVVEDLDAVKVIYVVIR